MTFAENRTYGVPEFARTEVNRHSGKLKGLSGYLQIHHDTMVGDKTQPQTIWSSAFIWTKIISTYVSFHSSKFGYSICPIFSKRHAEIFREF